MKKFKVLADRSVNITLGGETVTVYALRTRDVADIIGAGTDAITEIKASFEKQQISLSDMNAERFLKALPLVLPSAAPKVLGGLARRALRDEESSDEDYMDVSPVDLVAIVAASIDLTWVSAEQAALFFRKGILKSMVTDQLKKLVMEQPTQTPSTSY